MLPPFVALKPRYPPITDTVTGVNKDMIDASEWKAPKKRFFGVMVGQFDLRIKKKSAEPAAAEDGSYIRKIWPELRSIKLKAGTAPLTP